MDNTRPVHTNTADRAPNMSMTHKHVRMLVCTVCFEWNVHTNPVHPSESYLVSAVFFWIGTKIQKKSKKRNTQIEEKIIIFDDQFFRIIYLYLMRSIQKCDCSLLCINAHYFLSQINAKFYSVCINLYTWQKSTCRNKLGYCSKSPPGRSDYPPLENKLENLELRVKYGTLRHAKFDWS